MMLSGAVTYPFFLSFFLSFLDMFTHDAVIPGPAPSGLLPWGGVHYLHKEAAEFFMAVGESLEPQQFELRDYIAQDTKVVVLGYQRGKPSLQDDHMRLSLFIYGLCVMGDLQNSGYSMIRLA
jgi:hypothetical protein